MSNNKKRSYYMQQTVPFALRGGYQDVVTVEGETTIDTMLINAVMSNGDKYPLDPYLK